MKKKLLSVLLSAAMVTTLLTGCGGSDTGSAAQAPAAEETETAGKVYLVEYQLVHTLHSSFDLQNNPAMNPLEYYCPGLRKIC